MFTLPSSRDVVGGILLFAASADAFMPIGGMLPSIRTSSASVSVRATTLGPVMQMTKQRKQELLKNKDLPDLFKGNDEWRAKMMAKDEQFFYKSAQGQSPKYLWIGKLCHDTCQFNPASFFSPFPSLRQDGQGLWGFADDGIRNLCRLFGCSCSRQRDRGVRARGVVCPP